MVTVEAAIALAAFVAVLVLALACLVAVLDQLRCTDAAREAARLVARGESGRAHGAVDRIAPGARLSVSVRGDEVSVDVRSEPAGGLLPGVHLDARAFAVAEPGVYGGASGR
ncbi:MAG: TadE family type IV pilus minor pilin [Sciscionella sp.]